MNEALSLFLLFFFHFAFHIYAFSYLFHSFYLIFVSPWVFFDFFLLFSTIYFVKYNTIYLYPIKLRYFISSNPNDPRTWSNLISWYEWNITLICHCNKLLSNNERKSDVHCHSRSECMYRMYSCGHKGNP